MGIQSDSYHVESNGTFDLCRDQNGRLLEGTVITEDGIIRRFHKGLLDGDSWTPEGRRITQPAVEGPGHLEYWRERRLHRDDGLPAVCSRGFHHREWWMEGNRVRREDPETSSETGQNSADGNGNSPLDEVNRTGVGRSAGGYRNSQFKHVGWRCTKDCLPRKGL